MVRAVCCVVALVACGPKGQATTEPRPPEPAPADAAVPPPPVQDAAPTTPATDTTLVTPLPDQPSAGTAAYCLLVGDEKFVVRCYWTMGACTEQAAFNRDSGSEKSQECRGVAQAYCYTSDKSERCYPSSDDCDKNVASMRQRNRPATDCVAKTHP